MTKSRLSDGPVSGVILAAGRSTRMGRPKQLLDIAGKPMLQHVIDAAAGSVLEETVVVLDAAAVAIEAALDLPAGVRVVRVGEAATIDVAGAGARVGTTVREEPREGTCLGGPAREAPRRVSDRGEGVDATDGRCLADPLATASAPGLADSLRAGLDAAGSDAAAVAVLLGDQPEMSSAVINAVVAAFRASGSPCARPLYSAAGNAVPGHPVVLARSLWPAIRALRGDRGAGPLLAEHPEWVCEVALAGEPPVDVDRPEDYERLRSRLR